MTKNFHGVKIAHNVFFLQILSFMQKKLLTGDIQIAKAIFWPYTSLGHKDGDRKSMGFFIIIGPVMCACLC